MGSFSLWHWIVVFLMILVPALVIGLVVWLAVRLSRRRGSPPRRRLGGVSAPNAETGADKRLRQLQDLKEQGLVSAAEYEAKRAQILDQV